MARERILIVEDEIFIAMSLRVELERMACRVLATVSDGAGAVDLCARHEPDIVIMDVRLAGTMDGIQAAAAIREISSCRIIFVTGYPDRATEERALTLTPLGFLKKPVSARDIVSLFRPEER